MALYLLFELALGYSLFQAHGIDEISQNAEAVCNSILNRTRLVKVVKLATFKPFSALDALNQCNAVSGGILTDELRNFLESSLPRGKEGKKAKYIGSQISEVTKIPCQSNEFILELLCGVEIHKPRVISNRNLNLETDVGLNAHAPTLPGTWRLIGWTWKGMWLGPDPCSDTI